MKTRTRLFVAAPVLVTVMALLPWATVASDPGDVRSSALAFTEHPITDNFNAARSVYAADLDGDGDVDLLGAATYADDIAWWENDGRERFFEHTLDADFDGACHVTAADLDGDGDVDVLGAAQEAGDVAWWENEGSRRFAKHTIDAGFDGVRSVYAADMDGDGDLDVLGAAIVADEIAWWENEGRESFTKHTIADDCADARSVHAADLDGDGDVDVAGAGLWGFYWWENSGTGSFREHKLDFPSTGGEPVVYTADVDSDGDVDILGASYVYDTVAWWENEGNYGFTQQTLSSDFDGPTSVYATDMDGDGDVDVLGTASGADDIVWWENDGRESFTAHAIVRDFGSPTAVYAADIDGDGDVDVLGASLGDDEISWWEQEPGPGNTPPLISGLPDQTLLAGSSRDNAIDLWAFAADDESPDSALTFSIDNNPAADAGVSVDANRYVDIHPAPDWTGDITVVMRVTDPGGLADTDRFRVIVSDDLEWQIYLPGTFRRWSGGYAYPCDGQNNYCEEHDTYLTAYGPLGPGWPYAAYPDDRDDYYYFALDAPRTVTVRLQNYVATGDLLLYKRTSGGDIQLVVYWGRGGATMELEEQLPAGTYYVRIYAEKNHNSTNLYTLQVDR